jgi:ribosomal protein L35
MPKLKTHSGTKKRLTITKTGKVIRRHASGNHFLEKKERIYASATLQAPKLLSGKQAKSVSEGT